MKRIISLCFAALLLTSCGPAAAPFSSENETPPEYDSYIIFHAEDVSLSDLDDIAQILDYRARSYGSEIQDKFTIDRDNFDIRMDLVNENGWAEVFLSEAVVPNIVAFRKGTDPSSEALLGSSDIASVSTTYIDIGAGDTEAAVAIEFSDPAAEKFEEITGELAGTDISLSVWLDDEMLCAPMISAPIVDGNAILTGNFTEESANELSRKMTIGELPYKVTVVSSDLAG
ncbi:MAG: hypothetical protein J5501_06990 [Ruminococcus sp.]|nr:hypothetical protein [Ruminococcus sp.]